MARIEHGSYLTQYSNECSNKDLAALNDCADYLLELLDQCIPNDKACSCCAFQSLDEHCYSLCPLDPSSLYLAVLMNECEPLEDVDACSLPFSVDSPKKSFIKNLLSPKFDLVFDRLKADGVHYLESSVTDNSTSMQSDLSKNTTEGTVDLVHIANVTNNQVSNIKNASLFNTRIEIASNHSVYPLDSSGSNTCLDIPIYKNIMISLAFILCN